MGKHTYSSGIIGNCSYIAHVNKDTDISWLCWPRFDSSFIFGSLLDDTKGGEFSIRPKEEFTSEQYYIENTNVLVTEVTSGQHAYRITDFAPRFNLYERYYKPLMLIRKIQPLKGSPHIRVCCRPTGEYGGMELKPVPGSNHIDYTGMEHSLRLTTNVSLSYIQDAQYFVLNETKYCVLTYGKPLEAPLMHTGDDFLSRTVKYWQNWIKNTGISNLYQAEVIRSALALKIHQYEDTGAIIAASTTSLPEFDKSGRTWDYRFCWLRDAYYILNALNNLGHFEEAEHYFQFIANLAELDNGRYSPLYTITGGNKFREKIIDLKGYKGNKPVRIGNQAVEHIQNDVYGQVLLSLVPLYIDRRCIYQERINPYHFIDLILDKIAMTIDEPDAGIWEFRNFSQKHCYTNLFQWAGCKAAIKATMFLQNNELVQKAQALLEKAKANIEACYDPVRKVYTQAIGSDNLDASTLQLIMMRYLDPDSQRAKDHLAAVEKELKAENGLFYRYRHADDFGKPESTFLITAFWHVEALACVGRVEEATVQFNHLLGYANHLGLFSEDVNAADGSQWGNFPQAYSHVGLMNAAYRLAKKLDRPVFE